jgi:hypothetical protein
MGHRFAEPRLSSMCPASSLERNVIVLVVFSPGLQRVTDQTGDQPAKRNVPLLGGLPEMVQQII